MSLAPDHTPPGPGPGSDQDGYVLPLTALLLVPLLIFAALSTDVGGWYLRADQAQRAADAAALAGTVWLPDTTAATGVALDIAARNGFRDPAWAAAHGGQANATVTTAVVDGGLEVSIVTEAPSYLGAMVLDSIELRRQAVATVMRPVRLGNPSNGLGTGNLASSELGITPDGIWLSINGWCQDHQQGDPISVGRYGAVQAGGRFWDTCGAPSLGANPTLDPRGYTFIVDVPPAAGDVMIEVFEPGLCTDTNQGDELYSAEDRFSGGPRLNFRVYANDDTLLRHDDNLAAAPLVDRLFELNDCTGGGGAGGRWYNLYTIPAGAASQGRWYVQANARQNVLEYNVNSFSLRARPAADTSLCSSMTDPSCPDLYALEWMSLFRPTFGGSGFAGTASEFFLAEVSDEYAGKTLEVTMFDPGEGMRNVQFLDPGGQAMPFQFRLANCSVGLICTDPTVWPETALTGHDDCGGSPCLLVTNARFQDQFLVIEVDLPPAYSCDANCWWKVRYTPEANVPVTDRTTWSVRVTGGPVRLIG